MLKIGLIIDTQAWIEYPIRIVNYPVREDSHFFPVLRVRDSVGFGAFHDGVLWLYTISRFNLFLVSFSFESNRIKKPNQV